MVGRSALLCCMLAAASLACNEVTPPDEQIAAIEILPADLKIATGDSVDLHAIAMKSDGTPLPGYSFVWSTSDASLLGVTPSGRVGGVGPAGLGTSDSIAVSWVKATTFNGAAQDSMPVRICRAFSRFVGTRLRTAPSALGSLHRLFVQGSSTATFDGFGLINLGGIVVTTADRSFSTEDFPNFRTGSPHDFQYAGVCHFGTADGDYTRAVLLGLPERNVPFKIEMETFSPTIVGQASALLLRYTISNVSALPVSGIRFAFGNDWDVAINSPDFSAIGRNRTRFNTALDAAEAFTPDGATAGIASVGSTFSAYAGWGVTRLTFENRDGVLNLMQQGIVANTIGGDVETDAANLVAFGPFDLAPGQSRELMFVITAGYTPEQFAQNVAAARAVADAFPRRMRSTD